MLGMMEAVFGKAIMCGTDAQALAQLEQISEPARDAGDVNDNQPNGADDDDDGDGDEGGNGNRSRKRARTNPPEGENMVSSGC
jgi:hypothetical protein